jgi:lysozyme family protein
MHQPMHPIEISIMYKNVYQDADQEIKIPVFIHGKIHSGHSSFNEIESCH